MARRAFTLIELLIVVAIIGILAAIAVPNFINAQMRAKLAGTYSDLRIYAEAAIIYRNDNGAFHPHSDRYDQQRYLTTPVAYLNGFLPDRFQEKIDPKTTGLEFTRRLYHWWPLPTHEHIYGAFRRSDPFLRELYRTTDWWVHGWGPAHTRAGPSYDATNGLFSLGGIFRGVSEP
jgi:prepilin-type N-terminal cleavage/methylation domain-containing protein